MVGIVLRLSRFRRIDELVVRFGVSVRCSGGFDDGGIGAVTLAV